MAKKEPDQSQTRGETKSKASTQRYDPRGTARPATAIERGAGARLAAEPKRLHARPSPPARRPARMAATERPRPPEARPGGASSASARSVGARHLFNPNPEEPGEILLWARLLGEVQGPTNVAMGHNLGMLDGHALALALAAKGLNPNAPIVLGSCDVSNENIIERFTATGIVQTVATLTGQAVFAPDHLVPPNEVADVVAWMNVNHVDARGEPHPRGGIYTRDWSPPFRGWKWFYPTR